MQLLGRTSSKGTVYTQTQVVAQLFGPAVAEQWIFDWLGPDGRYNGDFTPYLDDATVPTITHDSTASIKRTLTFNIRSVQAVLANVSPLTDLVRVHYQLYMPDGGTIDFVVGTFILMPPKKEIKVKTNQTFQASDLSQLLVDGAFTSTFPIRAGASVGVAASAIVSSLNSQFPFQYIIPDTGKVLQSDLVWDPGVSRLQALNDVMAAFNYLPIFVDEFGRIRSSPVPDFSLVTPSFTFDLMNTSAGMIPISEQKDLSQAFNQSLVIVERTSPVPATFYVLAQNTSPLSEISIPRWHAKMGPVIRDSKIVDIQTAFARATAEVQQAARIYDPVVVNTLPWPVSQDLDVYKLFYSTADEGVHSDLFLELGWIMQCVPAGQTTHNLQKIIATS